MEKHYGEIVEYYVRKNGFSITELAAALNVNRRTIYNYFQNKYLKSAIIFNIGVIIRHDFSKDFPEFFANVEFEAKITHNKNNKPEVSQNSNVKNWKDKYIKLLEVYNETLSMRIWGKDESRNQKL